MTEAESYCAALVRSADKDLYLASLFAPDDKRAALLALAAFAIEIRRIGETVSEPHIGLIRQQWWLDTLDGIYDGAVPAHPVAQELARAIASGQLPKHALRNLVLAHEFDLYDDTMPDLAALEAYLGETISAAIQMGALILAGPDAKQSAEAAGFAGVAFGLSRLLNKAQPRHLPDGVTVAQAKAHAERRLGEARQAMTESPKAAFPAFLPVALTSLYLGRAGSTLVPSQLRRQFRLWWAAHRERI